MRRALWPSGAPRARATRRRGTHASRDEESSRIRRRPAVATYGPETRPSWTHVTRIGWFNTTGSRTAGPARSLVPTYSARPGWSSACVRSAGMVDILADASGSLWALLHVRTQASAFDLLGPGRRSAVWHLRTRVGFSNPLPDGRGSYGRSVGPLRQLGIDQGFDDGAGLDGRKGFVGLIQTEAFHVHAGPRGGSLRVFKDLDPSVEV